MRKTFILIFIFFATIQSAFTQEKYEIFALHNIIRGDTLYDTYDEQVSFLKAAGFSGVEINGINSFEGMSLAINKHHFKASYFYVGVSLQPPFFDRRLKQYISQLKGSQTIIAPYILADSLYPAGSRGADSLLVQLLKQVSSWASESGLQVAIYPHYKFYVENVNHALSLATMVNKGNVGLSFNLCHWLATTDDKNRKDYRTHLKALRSYIKMITICGANDVITSKPLWDDYILPLGKGSFDTFNLIKYCIEDLRLRVPIGVQCYNIDMDKKLLVRQTIQVWNEWINRLN